MDEWVYVCLAHISKPMILGYFFIGYKWNLMLKIRFNFTVFFSLEDASKFCFSVVIKLQPNKNSIGLDFLELSPSLYKSKYFIGIYLSSTRNLKSIRFFAEEQNKTKSTVL